jgi:hypothetical protein
MSKDRPIRCFDYVNHPYDKVRDALSREALAVFQNATKGAESRAKSVASALHVQLGSIDVGTDIAIAVKGVADETALDLSARRTRLELEWAASRNPRLFPLMRAELSLYPLTATETQLDFSGQYEPPLGVLGSAIDAVVGHRIAEASVHRFVSDVAEYLRKSLARA